MGELDNVQFANVEPHDPQIDAKVDAIAAEADINPFYTKQFKQIDLYRAIEERANSQEISEYVVNSAKFSALIGSERRKRAEGGLEGLFGRVTQAESSSHASGRARRHEAGYKVNPDYLTTVGVDPSKVLFFRATQPSEYPKPEYYWTSDLQEALTGLSSEIPLEQRQTGIILVADLKTINNNGGLIQDVNDDNGLAVRQIGAGTFSQDKCFAKFSSANNFQY